MLPDPISETNSNHLEGRQKRLQKAMTGDIQLSRNIVNARDWEDGRGRRCDFGERVRSRPYLETLIRRLVAL